MSLITLHGHRGGGDPWPDASVESYTWGANWGADFLEPDLYLTKDGILVASHDNIPQGFANVTYAEALALNPDLMTFTQVIEMVKQFSIETGRDIGIIPELKDQSYAAAEALVQTLVDADFTDPSRVIVQSFGTQNLQWLNDTLMPAAGVDFQLAFLVSNTSVDFTWIATFADIAAVPVGYFSAADVAGLHALGLKVVAWTIAGSESDIQSLVDMGVDGVFVDDMKLARTGEAAIEGRHVIYGTPQWDVVTDTAGDDQIYAMQGDDILRASAGGNDVLYGDAGNDLVFGGDGDDKLTGGSGTDYLEGGAGTDVLDGSTGNDVLVATGDEVRFRPGDGIDLVVADSASTITFSGIDSTAVTVTLDGSYLIIRAGHDALVIRDGNDAAHVPGTITFADGVTWTGAELTALAVAGSDAAVEAALPGLEFVLEKAPELASASTVAIGTNLIAGDGLGNDKLSETVADVEEGAVYRLSFTLADLGGTAVKVLWNGEALYEGVPDSNGTTLNFLVNGGSGDGSSQLAFEGAGMNPSIFDATLSDVSLVKLADPGVPMLDNAAPEAATLSLEISQDLTYTGSVSATDADSDPLVYTLGDGATHGTLTLNADGTYSYTPEAGYTGEDRFTYIVNDGHGGADEASVILTVKAGVLLGTDLIVNGSFEDLSQSAGNNGSGDWGYRNDGNPIVGWTEVNAKRIEQHWDTTNGVSAKEGSIWVDMNGYQNNTAITQTIAHVETGATYQLSFSLADVNATAGVTDGLKVIWGGQVVWSGVAPSAGWQTITLRVVGGSGDGSNTLQFAGNQANAVATTYGAALDDVHFVKLADAGETLPETAPDAEDGHTEGTAGEPIIGTLLATDADGDAPLAFSLAQGPAHGTVTVHADGTFSYTAVEGFIGTDSFTFLVDDGRGGTDVATQTLTIEAAPVVYPNLIVNGGFEDLTGADNSAAWGYRNTSPAGVIEGWVNTSDTRAEVHRDTVGGISAKEGTYWFDMEGAPNNATLVQTVAGVEAGVTYQLKFSIADTDTAQANDSVRVTWGGQVIYEGTPKAYWQEIAIDVVGGAGNGSNKLTIQSTTPSPNGAGVALDDVSLRAAIETPITGTDGDDALTGTAGHDLFASSGGNDTLAGGADADTYLYAADGGSDTIIERADATGTDVLRFEDADRADIVLRKHGTDVEVVLTDGSVVTLKDQLAGGGVELVTFADGTTLDWSGIAGGLVDRAPVAAADTLSAAHDDTAVIIPPADLLGNDTDADLDVLTIAAVTAVTGGTVALDAQGNVVFTPTLGYAGPASFRYTVSDGRGGSAQAQVNLEVDVDIATGQTRVGSIAVAGTTQVTVDGSLAPTASGARAIDAKNAMAAGTHLAIDVSGQVTSDDDTIRVNKDLANGTITIDNAGHIQSHTGQAIDLANVADASTLITIVNQATGVIMADNADAIRPGANSVVENSGQIIALAPVEGSKDAIDFQDDGAGTVRNHDAGLISGARHGITGTHGITVENDAGGTIIGNSGSAVNIDNGENGEVVTVVNHGTMTGAAHAGYADSDGDAIDTDGALNLDNYGLVQGLGAIGYHDGDVNVSEGVAAGGGTITNHVGGTIYGYGRAIQIDNSNNGPALYATVIVNEGLIQGDGHGPAGVDPADAAAKQALINGREAINIVGNVADSITNSGRIVGGIFTDGGDDTLLNTGSIAGRVDMGEGNDTVLLGSGSVVTGAILLGAGNDTLTASGTAGAVSVDGGAGDDRITTGTGRDSLHGGVGNDLLVGGSGSDTYAYALGDGADTITEGAGLNGDADSLVFTDIGAAGVTLSRNGADLQILAVDGSAVTVSGQFGGVAGQGVERLVFGGATFDIAGMVVRSGTGGADVLTDTQGSDWISAGAGNDRITSNTADDVIEAGAGNDTVYGWNGDKIVYGGAGNDLIVGGTGNSLLMGEGGNDSLRGGVGNETIDGGDGNDTLLGGGGNDLLSGGVGNDSVSGSYGNDQISGGTGNDTLASGGGNDTIAGGDGHDSIAGSYGNDLISGDVGNDTVAGGGGTDTISGGEGNDSIIGSYGNDLLSGDQGNDTLIAGGGNDTMSGGDGKDSIVGSYGNDLISGDEGNDTLIGGGGQDSLSGGAGQDSITGSYGNDLISGGDGNDTLIGGGGNDTIAGGEGNDRITGDYGSSMLTGDGGQDTITGGSGNETIAGGEGNDLLLGGLGSDTFIFGKGDGHDVVGDFNTQAWGHDLVQLDASAFADFTALMSSGHVVDVQGGVEISYDDGSTLKLLGVTQSSLHSQDFIFA